MGTFEEDLAGSSGGEPQLDSLGADAVVSHSPGLDGRNPALDGSVRLQLDIVHLVQTVPQDGFPAGLRIERTL